MKEIQSKF